ncbi:CMRF35-like molecule 1 isoform X1 [Clarias gariepinus]|uniref:CMRF35-like molecule 1 isoform X1 n=1 Tax=Clarias gariepinus TaxID=13013 RepID=UPI00234C5894|nr:CMRF35-like molecule 1 isoform X1 [Clarias gariepinus]XP_053333371.1 CMRF35-like molecule 1 isoform X1 [Clarias gariepinus]
MKKSFGTAFILLTMSVLGVVLNVAVNEEGKEGSAAVIYCPYNATYTNYPKYFCKGPKKECKTLMKTDDRRSWVFKGRLSLHDNTEENKFVVSFNNLTQEDEGEYGCGVNVSGPDLFIVVKLTVIKERPIPAVTSRPGSGTDSTGNSTQPTVSRSLDGREQNIKGKNVFLYIGGGFCAMLLVVSVISIVFKCRTKGIVASSIKDIKNAHIYEEIQLNHPAEKQASDTPDIMHNPNPDPAFHTIYATATNQNQEIHLSNTLPTSLLPCSKRLNSEHTEDIQKPKYCHVEIADAEDFNYSIGCNETYSAVQAVSNSPVYELLIAPQTGSTSGYLYSMLCNKLRHT